MAQIILDSNNNLIQGDFDNATINNRTKFKTTTTNATTNVYAVPNGSATSAGFTVTNAADPTNASKLTIATNGSTDTQIISGVNGSGTYLPLSFYTNNALAAQLTTAGNLTFGVADSGIVFNKTGALTNSTLNDYETGTWSPSLGGNTTYTIQDGNYTKIGRMVFLQIKLQINAIGTGSANTIQNLPFSPLATAFSTNGTGAVSYFNGSVTSVITLIPIAIGGGTTLVFTSQTASGTTTSNATTNIFTSGTRVDFTCNYIATS